MGFIGGGLAVALVAINYGWAPASGDESGGGYEYLVQAEPNELRALADGRVPELSSAPPADLRRIERVTITVGAGDPPPRELTPVDRSAPSRIAAAETAPQQQTVAKPVAPDWLPPRGGSAAGEAERRTAYQNPQNYDPAAVQRGFEQGTRPLAGVAQDLGRATAQTGRDLRDGAVGVVRGLGDSLRSGAEGVGNALNNTLNVGNDQYYQQRGPQSAAAPQARPQPAPQQGYTPFSYNQAPQPQQPAAAATNLAPQAGGQFAGAPAAGATPSQFVTPAVPQTAPQQQGAAGGGDIATRFGGPTQPAPAVDPRFDRDSTRLEPVPRNTASDGFRFDRTAAPVAANDFRNDPVTQQFGRQSNPPPNSQAGGFGGQSRSAPRPPSDDLWTGGPTGGPSFATPDFNAPAPSTNRLQDQQRPQQRAPQLSDRFADERALPPRTQQTAARSTAGVGGWADDPRREANPQSTAPSDQTPATDPAAGTPWLVGLLVASVAGNLFVGTGYLDTRNKYRAALRRLPIDMHPSMGG